MAVGRNNSNGIELEISGPEDPRCGEIVKITLIFHVRKNLAKQHLDRYWNTYQAAATITPVNGDSEFILPAFAFENQLIEANRASRRDWQMYTFTLETDSALINEGRYTINASVSAFYQIITSDGSTPDVNGEDPFITADKEVHFTF
ncbi:hypothetical protein HMPREF1624_08592 [Sporothrix schenckii ATCC 58251]|uniref:Velvet domain-containing protein n=1 Tax=Sporothrix schenckii (strain ATCC 58251 / de Perez 2211183) TaxID=1391915 RepID=U7PJK1_SPOS1|nr:hypothetical protein HMPREF1624_08592 [Sporothrix schenckii ATCC 58251]